MYRLICIFSPHVGDTLPPRHSQRGHRYLQFPIRFDPIGRQKDVANMSCGSGTPRGYVVIYTFVFVGQNSVIRDGVIVTWVEPSGGHHGRSHHAIITWEERSRDHHLGGAIT
ncbi:hypothetical protein FKM82_030019 [Ascaphus truei]